MGGDLPRRDVSKIASAPFLPDVGADQYAPSVDGVPDLSGRAVLVFTRGRTINIPIALTDCTFERQGGRLFLSGINQPCRSWLSEWCDGTRRFIAWDAVEEYVLFDSLADYHSRYAPPPNSEDEQTFADVEPDAKADRTVNI